MDTPAAEAASSEGDRDRRCWAGCNHYCSLPVAATAAGARRFGGEGLAPRGTGAPRLLAGGRVLHESGSAIPGPAGRDRCADGRAAAALPVAPPCRDVDRGLPRNGLPALLPDDSNKHRHTLFAAAGAVRGLILDSSAGIDVSMLRCVAVPADVTSAHAGGILVGAVASQSGAEVQSLDSAACQHPCEHLSERARGSLNWCGSRGHVPGAVARRVGVFGYGGGHSGRNLRREISFRRRCRGWKRGRSAVSYT